MNHTTDMGNIFAQSKPAPEETTPAYNILEAYLHQHPAILQMGDKEAVMMLKKQFPDIEYDGKYMTSIAKCRVQNYDLLLT
jgi:hypothetical protein